MKRLLFNAALVLLLLGINSLEIRAQVNTNNVFLSKLSISKEKLNKGQINKINHFKNKDTYSDAEAVYAGDFAKKLKNGAIPIRLPNNKVKVAKTKSLEVNDELNYKWIGQFLNGEGEVIIISQDGDVFGQIRHEEVTFKLISLGKGVSVTLNLDREKIKGKSICNLENIPLSENQIHTSTSTRNHCDNIRALVMFTDDAQTALGGVQAVNQTAQLAIAQMNNSFDNSNIDANMQLVGVQNLDGFDESNNLPATLADFVNDGAAARNQAQADVAILIIQGFNGAGLAQGIGPNNAFVVVDEAFVTDELVFAHEVGHLIGGRHEPCAALDAGFNCDDIGDFEHAHVFRTGWWPFRTVRSTIMRSQVIGSVIEHYSNPDIEFNNRDTGINNERDNSREFDLNACAVADLMPFDPPISVNISGPGRANNSGTYTWCANVSNCTNVTSYNWEYSTDGFSYFPFGTAQCRTASMPIDENLYLRVTATCSNGQTAMDWHTVLNDDAFGPIFITDNGESSVRNYEISKSEYSIKAFPNPAVEYSYIEMNLSNPGKVLLQLLDMNGKIVRVVANESRNSGKQYFEILTSNLNSGIYIIQSQFEGKVLNQKLIVNR